MCSPVARFNRFCCTLCNGRPGVIPDAIPGTYRVEDLWLWNGNRKQGSSTVCGITQSLTESDRGATQKGGFSSHSAFMRAAIERELAGRESGVDEAEQRIAASLDRMAREIHNLRIGQQALFAFVDVLAKTFLTCVPEPPRDVHDQAVARGKARYDRFLKSVGMAMVGDSQAAMAELLGRGHE